LNGPCALTHRRRWAPGVGNARAPFVENRNLASRKAQRFSPRGSWFSPVSCPPGRPQAAHGFSAFLRSFRQSPRRETKSVLDERKQTMNRVSELADENHNRSRPAFASALPLLDVAAPAQAAVEHGPTARHITLWADPPARSRWYSVVATNSPTCSPLASLTRNDGSYAPLTGPSDPCVIRFDVQSRGLVIAPRLSRLQVQESAEPGTSRLRRLRRRPSSVVVPLNNDRSRGILPEVGTSHHAKAKSGPCPQITPQFP